ncbi:hypothetical protein PspLS_11452 [Pyricularia sp. CBS 133598]|nr:hypothetical protein PspLS_11452 [Pyricularia sp. CBS 133598]
MGCWRCILFPKPRVSQIPNAEQEKAMQVWNKIFKDDEWLNTVMNQTYTHVSPPIPVLIGYDILKLYKGSDERVYLLLTANDWGGDIQYAPDIRHSLRPHKYDKESHEVSIEGTKITIALERYNMEELKLKEPQKLFHLTGKSKDKPETAALYYNEDVPVRIGEDEIGGIRDNDRLLVQDLSTIMSKFRDGKPVMRYIQKHGGTPPSRMIPMRKPTLVKNENTKVEPPYLCVIVGIFPYLYDISQVVPSYGPVPSLLLNIASGGANTFAL